MNLFEIVVFGHQVGCDFGNLDQLFLLHERFEVSDGFFHHTGGFHHLRKEHLTGTKEITDNTHAVHEWAFDNLQRDFVF